MRSRCVFVLLIGLLSGCTTLVKKPDSVVWHTCYQPIESVEAHAFMQKGIALLQEKYGAPDFPVKKVLLRQTVKSESAAGYHIAEHFSLLEIVDAECGIFCIYIGVPPEHERFYYLLGHEIGHLLHPQQIGVAEAERFCNTFSGQLCAQENRPFSEKWETRDWVRKR